MKNTRLIAVLTALLLALGLLAQGPATAARGDGSGTTARDACYAEGSCPKKMAKTRKRQFKNGTLGETTQMSYKPFFRKAISRKLRKKGLMAPRNARPAAGSYKYDGWGDYWDQFKTLTNCAASGSDFSATRYCVNNWKYLKKKPSAYVVGCGGGLIAARAGGAKAGGIWAGAFTCPWVGIFS